MSSFQPIPEPKKLTDWENEPSVAKLKGDLEASRSSHEFQRAKIRNWDDLLKVKGRAKVPNAKGRSSIQPKLIRRQAEWRYSALTEPFLGTDRVFRVDPATASDKESAIQNDMVLNWQFRTKLNKVKFIDEFVRATVDEGTSIIRVGWDRVTKKLPQDVPVYSYYPVNDPNYIQQFQANMQLKQTDPKTYEVSVDPAMKEAINFYNETQQITMATQSGLTNELVDTVVTNQPTLEVLDPENVIIDPSCNGNLDKAMFVIVSFETNKAELLKYPDRYKNLDSINWEGNSPNSEPDHATTTPSDFTINDPLRRKVVAYEYWGFSDIDGDGELKPIVATWIGSTMIRMEKNPFPDEKVPFVLVPYLPLKRELYGEPDAELLEDQQRTIGAITRGMIDVLARSANGQQGFAKGMLDPLNKRKFDSGYDYEFNPGINPQGGGYLQHTYPEFPNSALTMLQLQNNDAEALTGVKSFNGGISGDAYGDVASLARTALDAASKREMAILRRLAKGMVDIGNKIIAMNSVFLSEQETIMITDEQFVQIKREDLKGNFDLIVDINTAEVDNAKAQDLAFMLQTMGPNMDPSISMMILADIARLKRMPVLAKKLDEYQPPPPDPVQQQLQQLQLEKLQSDIMVNQSNANYNQARARELGSKSDLNNLNYVEQETGTTHARNMQLQQAQSEGNQNLAITKALTTPLKEGQERANIEAAVGFNQLSKQNSN